MICLISSCLGSFVCQRKKRRMESNACYEETEIARICVQYTSRSLVSHFPAALENTSRGWKVKVRSLLRSFDRGFKGADYSLHADSPDHSWKQMCGVMSWKLRRWIMAGRAQPYGAGDLWRWRIRKWRNGKTNLKRGVRSLWDARVSAVQLGIDSEKCGTVLEWWGQCLHRMCPCPRSSILTSALTVAVHDLVGVG